MNRVDPVPLSLPRLFRMMYWSAGRDRRRIPHLASVLFSFAHNWTKMRFWRHVVDRRPPVIIALMDRLGDIVSVEPVARFAREHYPDAPILWVTSAPYAALVAGFKDVDRAITAKCRTEWQFLWKTSSTIKVIDLHFSGEYCLECIISFHKSGNISQITADSHYNYGNQLTARSRCAGIPVLADAPGFTPDAESRRRVDQLRLPPSFIVMHCAASDPAREWCDENWSQLADFIAEQLGVEVVEIGLAPRAIHADGPRRRNLCGQLSIMETAEVIRRARLFIGIDSGPAHLANAMRTQGIILMGEFRGLKRYMPYSGPYETGELCDLILADGPVAFLPLASVLEAIKRRLADVATRA